MIRRSPIHNQYQEFARPVSGRAASLQAAVDRPGAATGTVSGPSQITCLPYGSGAEGVVEIPAAFGPVEAEYATIRRGAAIFDAPHRGLLEVTGADRRDFLNRMLTQELKDLGAGTVRQAFWLNRKGRLQADMNLIELGDRLLIDLDWHQADQAAGSLAEFLFAEDVQITHASDEFHQFQIHGPESLSLAARASGNDRVASDDLGCGVIEIAGSSVVLARIDEAGEIGLRLIVQREQAESVWRAVVDTTEPNERLRPIGWYAYNIARIEAGTPLFNIDFGPTNLPHETGILERRVSFTKGCYVGQEVVARMQSLGRPKQRLIGLRFQADVLPGEGSPVLAPGNGELGEEVGVITSSTPSPLLGAAPVAFAMVRSKFTGEGTKLVVLAEGEPVSAAVHGLRFITPDRDG